MNIGSLGESFIRNVNYLGCNILNLQVAHNNEK